MQASLLLSFATAIATIPGCQPGHESGPKTPATSGVPAASSSRPLEAFSRLIGGHWKMVTTAGRETFDTWTWGPGRQSIRSMRVGTLTEGDPWCTMTVYYWHPSLKEVRLLSVGSVQRGVGEGRITFEGDSAESIFSLNQTGGLRQLRDRWTFAGPDKYHDELSERVRNEYELLAGWDRLRVDAVKPPEQPAAPLLAPRGIPSELLRPLERVLGDVWATIAAAGAEATRTAGEPRSRATFEYVPHADAIYGRVDVLAADGHPSHAMDIYLYHHTGTQALRCLALRGSGPHDPAVYEGEIVPAGDSRSLTVRLTEHRPSGQQALEARVEFEDDDSARVQVWRTRGQERELVTDRRHSRTPG